MKTIVSGIATEYQDEGSGRIILMLHGWGDSLHSFDALVRHLSGYRMVRLDLPGFGGSELPRGTWSVADYAEFAKAFCEKIGVLPDFIVGHSMGGRITIKGESLKVLSARKNVFIASAGVADRPTVQNSAFMVVAKIGKMLLRPFPVSWYLRLRRELYRVTGGDYVSAGALKETFVKVINEDLSVDARKITVPTLMIWGEDDLVTPVSEGRKLHHLIAGSELKILRGAGHFVHQQKAAEVAQLIRTFL